MVVMVFLGATSFYKTFSKIKKTADVVLPTIINGELILPKLSDPSKQGLEKVINEGRLNVVSANLVGVFDQNGSLTGIRILGEIENFGDRFVNEISPVVRFLDDKGNALGQKIAHASTNFNFKSVEPRGVNLYDVTVDSPPQSEKMEIFFNTVSSSDSAIFETLKIASRSMEIKTATTGASESAQTVEYYLVKGAVVNPLDLPVTEIVVYAWTKNEEGKVFGFGKTEFKNDLLPSGEKIDFQIIVLPVQNNQKISTYEISAWGKRYKLNF